MAALPSLVTKCHRDVMTAAARPRAISTLIWCLISSYHLIYTRSFNLWRAGYANCPNYTKVGEWRLQTARESGLGAATASSQDLLLHQGDAMGAPAAIQAPARSTDRVSPAKHREANDVFHVCFLFSFPLFYVFFFFFPLFYLLAGNNRRYILTS